MKSTILNDWYTSTIRMLQESCWPFENVFSKLLRLLLMQNRPWRAWAWPPFPFPSSASCVLLLPSCQLPAHTHTHTHTRTQQSGTVRTTHIERKFQLGIMKQLYGAPSPGTDVWDASIYACHLCARAMLIFSVSFQF